MKVCCWAPTVHFDCAKNPKTDNWVLVAFFFCLWIIIMKFTLQRIKRHCRSSSIRRNCLVMIRIERNDGRRFTTLWWRRLVTSIYNALMTDKNVDDVNWSNCLICPTFWASFSNFFGTKIVLSRCTTLWSETPSPFECNN